MINNESIVVGNADIHYLNSGDPLGQNWVVPLCNTSIRPGWFYHQKEDNRVKTPQELLDVYYKSVGRNGILLLNIPPDKRGLFHENDIQVLQEFRSILDETFKINLAQGKIVIASNVRLNHERFSPAKIVDSDLFSYWAADDPIREATLEINLGELTEFDCIMIQEPIWFGQRVGEFEIEGHINGEWTLITQGTTIGYKRLLRISLIQADKIRLIIKKSNNTPAISNFGLYKSSEREKTIKEN
jgi:alpha-L-fucosidase